MFESTDLKLVLEISLFVIGFILLGIEMYMPGLQGPGIAGTISLVIAIFITADSIKEGVIITLIVLAVLIIMFTVIVMALSKGGMKSPIVLDDEQRKETGFTSARPYDDLIGKKGIAITDLRPSGTGEFEGKEYDIISEGKYISKDTNIIVHKVEGVRIVVKEDI